jgi:hypothetical protein
MYQPTAQPIPAAAAARWVVFSRAARTAIVAACRRGKRQAVLLSWPAGATYLPSEHYQPSKFDVVVRHIAGCPVYVDVRRLALFRNQSVLLDVEQASRSHPHPALWARPIPSSPQPEGQDPSGGPDSRDVGGARLADDVVDHLAADFAGVHAPQAIRAATRRAISELRGSVGREALPEMAARLVRQRLASNVPAAT